MIKKIHRWNYLLLGLVSVTLFITLLHQLSTRLAGVPGDLIDRNRREGLEVDAYFYSEVGDLREFLDDEQGRYGRRSLRRALEKKFPTEE